MSGIPIAPASLPTDPVPLILLTGMNRKTRLFAPQLEVFPQLTVPAWIPPQHNESLRGYAQRFAQAIDPGCPCIVGGASLGGIVAHEMAPFLQTKVCLLICSVRCPQELAWRWRTCSPLSIISTDFMKKLAEWTTSWCGFALRRRVRKRLRWWSSPEAAFVRWASRAVLGWRISPAARRMKTRQIHGQVDPVLPIRGMRPDVVVPGGGHVLPLTHSESVNEFLRREIERE